MPTELVRCTPGTPRCSSAPRPSAAGCPPTAVRAHERLSLINNLFGLFLLYIAVSLPFTVFLLAGMAYGQPFSLLPYGMQNEYQRNRQERPVDCIVLENRWLTATFRPGFGGRLWSLVHRPTVRELSFRNPIPQSANLALRGA